jgi:hypothetical protein
MAETGIVFRPWSGELEKQCAFVLAISTFSSSNNCLIEGYEPDRRISDPWNKIFGNHAICRFRRHSRMKRGRELRRMWPGRRNTRPTGFITLGLMMAKN